MENFGTDQSPILEREAAVEGGAEEAPAGTLQFLLPRCRVVYTLIISLKIKFRVIQLCDFGNFKMIYPSNLFSNLFELIFFSF